MPRGRQVEDLSKSTEDFGRWKVLERAPNTKGGCVRWVCECQCEHKTISLVNTYDLKNKCSTQCRRCRGKHGRQLYGKKSKSWKGVGDIPAKFWHNLLGGAKRRNLQVDVTLEEIWDLFLRQNRKCALTGVDLCFGTKAKSLKDGNASLDRIDSNLGYTLTNIQFVDKTINKMKLNLHEEDFISLCEKVVSYHNFKNSGKN